MTYALQFSIPYFTGIPSDVVTNTFHFDWQASGDPDDSELENLADRVVDFYEDIYNEPGVGNIAIWAKPELSTCKIYNLDDPLPRVPIYDEIRPLTTIPDPSSTVIPTEVACCLSYHGTFASGTPKASQRGRLYIGMLADICMTNGLANSFARPSNDFMQQLGFAASTLATPDLGNPFQWVVYSRKLEMTTIVTSGWVDNAFDTQRRRGQAASARDNWSV